MGTFQCKCKCKLFSVKMIVSLKTCADHENQADFADYAGYAYYAYAYLGMCAEYVVEWLFVCVCVSVQRWHQSFPNLANRLSSPPLVIQILENPVRPTKVRYQILRLTQLQALNP